MLLALEVLADDEDFGGGDTLKVLVALQLRSLGAAYRKRLDEWYQDGVRTRAIVCYELGRETMGGQGGLRGAEDLAVVVEEDQDPTFGTQRDPVCRKAKTAVEVLRLSVKEREKLTKRTVVFK